jgi:hypothetical protein
LSISDNYTEEEWNTILRAPALAAIFIIQADVYSPSVAYLKTFAAFTAILETAQQGSSSELVTAVTEALLTGQIPADLTDFPDNLADARRIVLEGCRQAAALLAQRAPHGEADAYNRWLMMIGQHVARVSDYYWLPGQRFRQPDEKAHTALEALAAALEDA